MFRLILALSLMAVGAWELDRPAVAQSLAQWDVRYDALVADAKAQMFGDPLIAIERARAAEGVASHLAMARRNTAVATAQWLQGEAYLRLNDTARAEPLIERAISLVAKPASPTKLYGDLLLSRGGLRLAKADVAGALSAYQQAHNIFRDIGDARSRAISIVSIGFLYQEAGDFKTALRYFDQSADIYHGDQRLLFSIYTNRGICLMDFNKIIQRQRLSKGAGAGARFENAGTGGEYASEYRAGAIVRGSARGRRAQHRAWVTSRSRNGCRNLAQSFPGVIGLGSAIAR